MWRVASMTRVLGLLTALTSAGASVVAQPANAQGRGTPTQPVRLGGITVIARGEAGVTIRGTIARQPAAQQRGDAGGAQPGNVVQAAENHNSSRSNVATQTPGGTLLFEVEVQDAIIPHGVAGVTVSLVGAGGRLVSSATTGADGGWVLPGLRLPPGRYVLRWMLEGTGYEMPIVSVAVKEEGVGS